MGKKLLQQGLEKDEVGGNRDLCSRIRAYLDTPKAKYNEAGKMLPGQQTTNITMNGRQQSSDNSRIEILKFNELQVGDANYLHNDLADTQSRLLVEKIAIVDHAAKHQKLLNLDS
jgi:hypothetical protein